MRPREARAPQLLSQGALEPMFHAKPLGRNREQPLLAATRGGPRTAVKTPHSQKQIINKDCLQVEMEERLGARGECGVPLGQGQLFFCYFKRSDARIRLV